MAHTIIIQAIKIYLPTVEAENTALGIYTSGTSEIRLSEEVLSGVSNVYTSGLIAKNGIGDISEGADLSRGGNVAEYKGLNIDLINTNQYVTSLRDIGVYLPGCACKIIEFIGTELDSDASSETVIFAGVIEDIAWTETICSISIKNDYYKKNYPLSKKINTVDFPDASDDLIGKTLPMSLGSLYPDIDTNGVMTENLIAKFIRTEDKQNKDTYSNFYFTGASATLKIFPVKASYNNTQFTFYVSGVTTITSANVSDCYVVINSGDGAGQIRRVLSFAAEDPGVTNVVICTIESVWFYEDGGTTTVPSVANDDTRSWVQFIHIVRSFSADSWPCKNFLDDNGSAITTPQIYVDLNDKYSRVANYGFTIATSNNNAIAIDGQQYSENIDTLKSFTMLPITDLALETDTTLKYYGSFFSYAYSTYTKKASGVYAISSHNYDDNITLADNTLANPTYAYDKNYSTKSTYAPAYTHTHHDSSDILILNVVRVGLPKIPDNIDVKYIYVGIKSKITSSSELIHVTLAFSRFAYTKTTDTILSAETSNPNAIANFYTEFDCLPDFYYETNAPSTNSSNFYRKTHSTALGYNKLYGYEYFKLSITKEEFNTYDYGALISGIAVMNTDTTITNSFEIYDMAIMLELNDATISSEVYSPLSGRKYNDTWGTRKIAANAIANPVDMLEHVKRLAYGGQSYDAAALIKTSGDGSYDDASLNTIKVHAPAFQIFDEDKQYAAWLSKKICSTYDLCSRIDSTGYECVYALDANSPAETVQFSDLIGNIGEIQEPKLQDVFCEPVVKYQYNYVKNDYDKELRIYNISGYAAGGSYTASSAGFANQTDAEAVLNLCSALYAKVQTVEKCDGNFSECDTITTYADALAYIKSKLGLMGNRRLSLTVSYLKGSGYFFGKHINVKLPHQTKNYALECVIESITKSKKSNTVSMDLILLHDITS